MKRFVSSFVLVTFALGAISFHGPAWAQTTPAEEAQAAFKQGAEAVEAAEWARALGLFEKSRALYKHPLTTYNIAVCQRFLGRYTLAGATLKEALAENAASGLMPALFVEQAKTYAAELEAKLVRVTIHAHPAKAAVLVEGRPLAPTEAEAEGTYLAGVAPAGKATSVGRETFVALVDPGTSVFTFSLDGYHTIDVSRTLRPGTSSVVDVSMEEQPASIRLTTTPKLSIVKVDGVDFGPAPVLVTRGPGPHRISVTHEGYTRYDSSVTLHPGQLYPLDAHLVAETRPFYKTFWFWGAASATAIGIGIVTFLVARPAPTRPDVDRGGLDWAAQIP